MVTLVQAPPQKPLTLEDRVAAVEARQAAFERALLMAFRIAGVKYPDAVA